MTNVATLKQGFRKSIGNGRSTKPPPSKVADLIKDDREWDSQVIWKYFDLETAKQILALSLPKPNKEDAYEWTLTKNGQCSVKTGYWLQVRGLEKAIKNLFPKRRLFLWKIWNNPINVTENVKRKGLHVNELCIFCNKHEESASHLFRECEIVARIWKASSLGINVKEDKIIPARVWVFNWLNYLAKMEDQSDQAIFDFIYILWSIWLARNEVRFRGTRFHPESIMHKAKAWSRRATQRIHQTSIQPKEPGPISKEFRKGSLNQDTQVGIIKVAVKWKNEQHSHLIAAWIIYHQGQVLEKNAKKPSSKLQGPRNNPSLYSSSNRANREIYQLIIWTESTGLIEDIKVGPTSNWQIKHDISNIRDLSSSFSFLCIKKVHKHVIFEVREMMRKYVL
ncbi:hypothetical protein RDABS01_027423 [Bienertia sinuspersici]